jgi:hypothetical protein
MHKKHCLLGFVIVLSLLACSKEKEQTDINYGDLIGYWSNPSYSDSVITYNKLQALPANDYCISFHPDHKCIEQKNSSWCGTPPVEYAIYEGSWNRNDSLLYITVGYWGGLVDMTWKIVSVGQNHLSIIVLETNFH